MSASSDKLPPVPSQTALADPSRPSYFGATWSQWFTQVKAKVDIINASIVGVASISGTGLTIRTSTGWVTRSIQGTTGEVEVLNGDGVGGNPTIQLAATAVTPGSYTNTDITVDAFGRVTAASNGTGSGAVSGPASSVDNEVALFSGTTGKLLKGGGLLGDAVRAALLTGLSLVTSTAIAATDSVLQAFGKLQAQITDNLLPKGYIDGLQMQWGSGTALTVSTGAAYIEGSSKVLRATADIAKTGLVLTASTWYHVYLYDNAGTPDVELSTTAPASPYNGTARSKTGDSSRRYVGSVRTDASGNIYEFDMLPSGLIFYANHGNAAFRLLSAGSATVITDIDASALIPTTARLGYFRFQVNGGSYTYLMPGGATSIDQADLVASMGASVGLGVGVCRLGNGQKISYMAHDSTTPTYIWAHGYYVER